MKLFRNHLRKVQTLFLITIISLVLTGCNIYGDEKNEINVGYFPNISHAGGIVGMSEGIYEEALKDYDLGEATFPNGSLFMDALSTGQIDIGFVGPGPVLNRYLQGGDVVIIGNTTTGGNVLVLRNDIEYNDPRDLEGLTIATASTGCTHDLLLRKMLEEYGMAVEDNGGTVKRIPQRPATNIGMLQQNQIDGALVSEPWASMMGEEGVGRVVVEFDEVPWKGQVPATVIATRKDFLEENPEFISEFLEAHEKTLAFIQEEEERTIEILQREIEGITDQRLSQSMIQQSLKRVTFTSELNRSVVSEFAELLIDLDFIESERSIKGIFAD